MQPHPRSIARRSSLVLAAALALGACQHTPSEPASGSPPPAQPSPTAAPGAPGAPAHAFGDLHGRPAAGPDAIAWTDPAGWSREQPTSQMRRAQYRIPRASGDTADGELVVFYFGEGQGGDTEANLTRWFGQVQQPDGRATADVATRRTLTVGAYNVTIAEAAGRLGGASMPGMPAAPAIEHGRLLGAIVQTPQGPWFFKLTGPDATVAAARPAFEGLLQSIHAGS